MDHLNTHLKERCEELLPDLQSRLGRIELYPVGLQTQSRPKVASPCGLKPLSM